ncbi:inositol-1-monophosphatase [Candidatus Fukatsuia symbiotica]|uniref:inositol-1-monophosphatase n=1 Tax=Candidatus Fukatsuia TaxID=1927833 RepID=UPI000932BA36|nr:inositol-1-monophosphatase [Candidatus Fukatsuia symbiotica]MEA9445261.1 inositol-1-monophosphatase [Candidatus Fukatsuia symbiotica]
MHPMLTIAIRSARKAGDFIAQSYHLQNSTESSNKSRNDFVTCLAQGAERQVIDVIKKYYPKHSIIAKHCGERIGDDRDVQWVIDPLGGVANFIKCLPHFAISVAVRIKEHTEVAAIYDPVRNELFTAVRGQGAQLNGYRLRVIAAQKRDLRTATLVTALSVNSRQHSASYLNIFNKLFMQCTDMNSSGSSVLDLAYVAASRVDGFFGVGLEPRDFIGGELLIRESGALITDFTGNHNYYDSGNVVAGNSNVVKAMLQTIREESSEALKR